MAHALGSVPRGHGCPHARVIATALRAGGNLPGRGLGAGSAAVAIFRYGVEAGPTPASLRMADQGRRQSSETLAKTNEAEDCHGPAGLAKTDWVSALGRRREMRALLAA
jgi:hypothetical protein